MLRFSGRLRPLAAAAAEFGGASSVYLRFLSSRGVLPHLRERAPFPLARSVLFEPPPAGSSRRQWEELIRPVIFSPFQLFQKRGLASKERRSRAPATPVTSKVKKYKIKGYSSFKSRFRTLNDGNIRRWRAGKRHNAHLKSKKAKRRLRRPEVVTKAYAKVMKKLHFCA
ncbi:unnamed protein product [Spirodela intermedia]|uniref:50S ribosomal protein L35 n=1 Tax=Spirodela intermedia TaxID=51605 RepID=A0A7I8JHG4_SPIIN|nr:unnamed protein product [Spirodela intermedia]CAA6669578.1 unnamed protein product [Spirodela intermedia]